MNEDRFIQEKFGKKQPFKVPEGYFDAFAKGVMEQLPHESQTVPISAWRRWRIAAAVAVAACFSALLFNVGEASDNVPQSSVAMAQRAAYYDDLEEIADYAMMDVSDIYAYVSDY